MTIIVGTTAATGVVTVGGGALGAGILLGGVALLKGLLLLSLARRSRRSAEQDYEDDAFLVLNNAEPAQCYRRLVCDMAAGAIPDEGKILSLFNKDVSPVSPKFDYVSAAKVGKLVKNAALCEVRYTCPLSTQEIAKLF